MQGGVGDYTRELGPALLQLGHPVVTVTSSKASARAAATSLAIASEPDVRPAVDVWDWSSWARILGVALESRCDVLHIQYQTAAYAMHPAINLLPLRFRLEKNRPRVVATFHDLRLPYLFPKAGPVRRWINLQLALQSDAVIATNVEDYRSLARWPLGERALRLIPIGSNIRPRVPHDYDRTAWRDHLGVAEDETLLCYFGFLNDSKGGDTLIRTLAELVRRGKSVRLLMIGGQVGDSDPTNVAYLEHVRALILELDMAERVLWTGYTGPEEVSASFASADICILPYRDGASYRRGSFMAALAHGMPIISTTPRTSLESLVDGENVRLVPPDNHTAAADAADSLMASPATRSRLRQGALELARQFSWEGIAERTAQLYSEILRT
jgi:glycosyltransferase involved in cell wall biosynthesis